MFNQIKKMFNLLEQVKICAGCKGLFMPKGVILINESGKDLPMESEMTSYCRYCYSKPELTPPKVVKGKK